ncbi:hypothetical protein [Pseudomonas costantinii]|uniref:3-hydroxyacyl-ACP dehydratase n=2 Tax=Pseudomonas costantinii TaxID=168469 RepID=A0A1S2V7P0_9PSED|nr:hypothetical protein [Pseudomonas costantinii]OIN53998.1 hypothetical protein BFL40_07355 [Pseudomonas costantinii]SED17280.1 hypothetical protein SAMN04515675_0127 [Pseudomonas costantinii]
MMDDCEMHMDELESAARISALAQGIPFRFIDRVRFLDRERVITELHRQPMPGRFVDNDPIEMIALLEFAAQSSGLILRERRERPGGPGMITSFSQVQRKLLSPLQFPLYLESRLTDERHVLFDFAFEIRSAHQPAVSGNVGIYLRG